MSKSELDYLNNFFPTDQLEKEIIYCLKTPISEFTDKALMKDFEDYNYFDVNIEFKDYILNLFQTIIDHGGYVEKSTDIYNFLSKIKY